jgi:hypothetical protein
VDVVVIRWPAGAVVGGLVLSAAALFSAPALMSASYSWIANTVSESAAQGVEGAWLARLGFVLFGLAVMLLSAGRSLVWGRWATAGHVSFGAFMVAVAAFSAKAWTGAPFDPTEDALHSLAATGMGFAFAFGVVATFVHARRAGLTRPWWPDAVAVVASVAAPTAMTAWPDVDGIPQRLMFVIAYAWYLGEAVRTVVPHRQFEVADRSRKPAHRTASHQGINAEGRRAFGRFPAVGRRS